MITACLFCPHDAFRSHAGSAMMIAEQDRLAHRRRRPPAMAESLILTPGASRQDRYAELLPQLQGLIESEADTIATLANLSAALSMAFGFHWVGFYLVKGDELVLGPFQGPLACTRIPRGKGVCGAAWAQATTLVVPDVNRFPGHIACSAASVSEIVVPLFAPGGAVWAVLDIDSVKKDDFSEVDRAALEQVARWLHRHRPPDGPFL